MPVVEIHEGGRLAGSRILVQPAYSDDCDADNPMGRIVREIVAVTEDEAAVIRAVQARQSPYTVTPAGWQGRGKAKTYPTLTAAIDAAKATYPGRRIETNPIDPDEESGDSGRQCVVIPKTYYGHDPESVCAKIEPAGTPARRRRGKALATANGHA